MITLEEIAAHATDEIIGTSDFSKEFKPMINETFEYGYACGVSDLIDMFISEWGEINRDKITDYFYNLIKRKYKKE